MPLTEACEMVTLDPPVLVSVTVCDCLAPTATLPKSSLVALSPSCPAAVPVPESERFGREFDASLVMVAVALKNSRRVGCELDADVAALSRGDGNREAGRDQRKILGRDRGAADVTDAVPEFVAVTGRVLLLPAATLPKSRLEVPQGKTAGCCWLEGPAALTPWQPTRKVRHRQKNQRPCHFPKMLGTNHVLPQSLALSAMEPWPKTPRLSTPGDGSS